MILDCHLETDERVRRHGAAECEAADGRLVEAAYACGVDKAYLATLPDEDPDLILRVVMSPSFLVHDVLHPPEGRSRPVDVRLGALDLDPLRAAVAERSRIMRRVGAERRTAHMALDEEAERSMTADLVDASHDDGSDVLRWSDGTRRLLFHADTTGSAFEAVRPLTHFGGATCVARHVAKAAAYGREDVPVDVHAAYLSIRRPLRIVDRAGMTSRWMVDAARDAGAIEDDEAAWVLGVADASDAVACELRGHPIATVEVRLVQLLEAKGYDGLVYANKVEGGGDSWVVFGPGQVEPVGVWRYESAGDGRGLVLVEPPREDREVVRTPPSRSP